MSFRPTRLGNIYVPRECERSKERERARERERIR